MDFRFTRFRNGLICEVSTAWASKVPRSLLLMKTSAVYDPAKQVEAVPACQPIRDLAAERDPNILSGGDIILTPHQLLFAATAGIPA